MSRPLRRTAGLHLRLLPEKLAAYRKAAAAAGLTLTEWIERAADGLAGFSDNFDSVEREIAAAEKRERKP